MAPSSSYRDRTSEFNSVADRLKRNQSLAPSSNSSKGGAVSDGLAVQPEPNASSASTFSEFSKKASRVGLGIHDASKKVARLAKLAKRSSIFDDPAREIQDLIALLKQDITALNAAVLELQSSQAMHIGGPDSSKDSKEHSKTIVDNLKGRLMQTTNEFKEVLTVRTENLKLHENRRQLFTAAASGERGNPFAQNSSVLIRGTDGTSITPPPWANSSSSSQLHHSSGNIFYGTSRSTQLRRRTGGDGLPLMQSQLQMQQESVPRQDQLHGKSSALQHVESTITELSGMFTQLATMVSQHEELAIRIDDNLEDSLANVEGAQGALLKYLHRVSSNRWLILKIFFVLLVFLMVFIIFIA